MSAARPKIADYPFTTLVPHLGVVRVDDGAPFTVADVPGLIPGASSGRGLGLEFLRHVERCSVLVHVIDCATLEPGRDPVTDLDVIEAELAAYRTDLTARPRLVVLNKVDVPQARELADLVLPDLQARGLRAFPVSAATHEGLRRLVFALAGMVAYARQTRPAPVVPRVVLRPRAVDEPEFEVTRDAEGFVVTGDKPLRWVHQTDFSNDEAVGYLADRLARLGVEEALASLDAEPGVQVKIGHVSFDWDPTTPAGAARVHGPRGSDVRLAPPPHRRHRAGTAGGDGAASEDSAAGEDMPRMVPAARPRNDPTVRPGGQADRRQGRLVLLWPPRKAAWMTTGWTRWSTPSPRAGLAEPRSSWCLPARSLLVSRRCAWLAGRETWPRCRQRLRSGRAC